MGPWPLRGDTIRCGRERIRIANIDARELSGSPKCQDQRRPYAGCDYRAGKAARLALLAAIARWQVMITRLGTYASGRTFATVSVNGVDLVEVIVSMDLALPWR